MGFVDGPVFQKLSAMLANVIDGIMIWKINVKNTCDFEVNLVLRVE